MKRISKGYWVAAALLLLWAMWDFYHYFVIGHDLISYYDNAAIIHRLVANKLFQGIVKAVLGVLVLFVGWRRGKKGTLPSSLAAVTALLTLVAAGIWGVSMYCVTAVTAECAAARYLDAYKDFASTLSNRSFYHWMGKEYDQEYANYDANRMWEAVDSGSRADGFPTLRASAEGNSGFLDLPDSDMVYSAAAVYDEEGNLLVSSWEDYFYFEYLTKEQWQSREERSGNSARAPIERSMLTEAGLEMVRDGDLTFDAQALRFTGSFDGVTFTPKSIEAIEWETFDEVLRFKGSGSYTVSGVAEDYDLPWISLYENPDAVPAGAETTTLYSDWFDVCWHRPSPAFSYNGEAYDGLDALVEDLGPGLSAGLKNMNRYEGLDLLIPSVDYCYQLDGELYYTPYYYGQEAYDAEPEVLPQVQFYVVSAVYCSPWRTAWEELRYVYLFTFLLATTLILLARSVIRRRLIDPVEQVGTAMAEDIGQGSHSPGNRGAWQECWLLQDGWERYRDTVRMQKNEITRLNTALEYAKKAEENRRQMTSNIAHELKTPLAVIHSYAEGLKEHAAEEKRDKYIDVILAEAERTDSMVLEMLDLSRLEAGKVKLSRDDFSLIDLTKSIFEKLEITAQAKNLRIEFSFPDNFTVTADESRIAQVIENFASNAVKYTVTGGHVNVSIQNRNGKTTFSIENESTPLSDEALQKVWDTFYRADESRSGGGTGLGLAIAKSIIELHGGKCSVQNTTTGVKFSFTI